MLLDVLCWGAVLCWPEHADEEYTASGRPKRKRKNRTRKDKDYVFDVDDELGDGDGEQHRRTEWQLPVIQQMQNTTHTTCYKRTADSNVLRYLLLRLGWG